jgi:hypothetical protein
MTCAKRNLSSYALSHNINIAPTPTVAPRRYIARHTVNQHATSGRLKNAHAYALWLSCVPGGGKNESADTYTCERYAWTPTGKAEVTVPDLHGWTYRFAPSSYVHSLDEEGRMWGIPHERFEGLKDSNGRTIPINPRYQVYNSFTYFHSLCGSHIGRDEADRLTHAGDRVRSRNESTSWCWAVDPRG